MISLPCARAKTAIWVVALLALSVLGLCFWVYPPSLTTEELTAASTLLFIAVISEFMALTITESGSTSTMDFVPHLAAILLLGPTYAAIIAVLSWIVFQYWMLENPPHKVVYNTAQITIAVSLSGAFYFYFADPSILPVSGLSSTVASTFTPYTEFLRYSIPPFVGASVIYFGVNYSSVSLIVALTENIDFSDAWRKLAAANVLLFDVATSFVAYGVVVLYVEWGPLALILTLVPIIGVRYSSGLIIELRQLNSDLLRVLVNTLEAQDPYTSGHSIRVAEMAKRIAKELGLGRDKVQDIETAALLHDIGKIDNAYHEILQQEGPLTDQQRKLIKDHPARGVEIIESVRSLDASVLNYIRHHHEHYDGSGYPNGLAGEDIPLGARIIMVSDTIDAMRTTRPYRDALAIETIKSELQNNKGSQFDPRVVDAAMEADVVQSLENHSKVGPQTDVQLEATAG